MEDQLQRLTNAILDGKVEEARQSTYAALARGSTTNEVLDAMLDAVNIVVDLHEVGEYDQDRVNAAEAAVNSSLQVIEDRLAKAESRFDLKATVGPVGIKAGNLLALALSAALRSVGLHASEPGENPNAARNSQKFGGIESRSSSSTAFLRGDRAAVGCIH